MTRPRCLLLNPPGDRPYTRDCLHSDVNKATYYWHQLDLLVQSGWLDEVCEVGVLDAIAERLDVDAALDRAAEGAWDHVLFLVGEPSYEADVAFVSRLAERLPEARFYVSGDVVFFRGAAPFEEIPRLDGVVTDFSADGVRRHILGERGALPGLRSRDDDGTLHEPAPTDRETRYPRPRHGLFPLDRYRLPFGRYEPFASVLTNFGCPYGCTYCNARMVGYRYRPVEDVLEELQHVHDLGIRKLYIRDPTFATRRNHALEICQQMAARGLVFEWNAFTRSDRLDAELLGAMAASGCKVVQLGLETPDLDALAKHGKKLVDPEVRETIRRCHEAGIEVCGHFIIGFPEDDPASWDAVADHAIDVGCDYFALNVAEVRLGTSLTGGEPARTRDRRRFYFDEEMLRAKVQRLNRRFYARPRFIWRQLMGLRRPSQLMRLARLGAGVIAPRPSA